MNAKKKVKKEKKIKSLIRECLKKKMVQNQIF